MTEVSPLKSEGEGDSGRVVALGGMRRVFKSRERSRLKANRKRDEDGNNADAEDENDGCSTRKTSNHYTLNLPSVPAPQSDTPYILLGYIPCQYLRNRLTILIFLVLDIFSSSSTSHWLFCFSISSSNLSLPYNAMLNNAFQSILWVCSLIIEATCRMLSEVVLRGRYRTRNCHVQCATHKQPLL
jgi:hypothetical protein